MEKQCRKSMKEIVGYLKISINWQTSNKTVTETQREDTDHQHQEEKKGHHYRPRSYRKGSKETLQTTLYTWIWHLRWKWTNS